MQFSLCARIRPLLFTSTYLQPGRVCNRVLLGPKQGKTAVSVQQFPSIFKQTDALCKSFNYLLLLFFVRNCSQFQSPDKCTQPRCGTAINRKKSPQRLYFQSRASIILSLSIPFPTTRGHCQVPSLGQRQTRRHPSLRHNCLGSSKPCQAKPILTS